MRFRSLRRIWQSIVGAAKSRSGVAVAGSFAILAVSSSLPADLWVRWFGDTAKTTVALAILVAIGVLAFCCLLFVLHVLKLLSASPDAVPKARTAYFSSKVLETYEDARLINDTLVQQIFPDGSIERTNAIAAQVKNPRRLVGLIDERTNEIAGWSSLWPVKATAGLEIELGTRLDDDLKVDDLLPEKLNSQAKYLILLSFGVLPEFRDAPECPVRRLGRAVIDHIMDEFLAGTESTLRMVAVAYSPEGERLCRLLGLKPTGQVARYASGAKPIFVADATHKSLLAVCRRI